MQSSVEAANWKLFFPRGPMCPTCFLGGFRLRLAQSIAVSFQDGGSKPEIVTLCIIVSRKRVCLYLFVVAVIIIIIIIIIKQLVTQHMSVKNRQIAVAD